MLGIISSHVDYRNGGKAPLVRYATRRMCRCRLHAVDATKERRERKALNQTTMPRWKLLKCPSLSLRRPPDVEAPTTDHVDAS